MIRRGLASFLLVLVPGAAAFATDLPGPWRSWHYSRAVVDLPRADRTPVTIHLPFELFAQSDTHGSDLRIIDERGQEIPYLLNVLQGESKTDTRPSRIVERSFVLGRFTQIVVRVTDKPPLDESRGATLRQLDAEPWFNTYRIATPETDFMYWVETAVGDDAHQWRIIDARSPISRFRKHGLDGNQTIQFEGFSNQRYLRLRIFDPDRQFPVDGVEVLSRSSSEPPRIPLPCAFSTEKSSEATESRWSSDLKTPNLPASELALSTEQPEFYRAVRISTSEDQKEWGFRAAGEIYRYHQANKLKESLRIDFPEVFARFWRVDIINGNDRELAGLRLELRGLERQVMFQMEPDHTYRIIYGNDRAFSPQYDFARIFDQKIVMPLPGLGSEEITANYVDPRPYTERHLRLLWLALGIAVILLAYAALRALRSPKPSAP
jgi:hypothetical protein